MRRIDTPTKAVDLFGPGRHGFKDGSPLTGEPATTLNGDWFNAVQEEIAAVIEAGGGALDGQRNDQMAAALGLLAVEDHGTHGQIGLPGGFLLKWGVGLSASNVLFDPPFPTRCLGVAPAVVAATGAEPYMLTTTLPDRYGFTAYAFNSAAGGAQVDGVALSYLALGR